MVGSWFLSFFSDSSWDYSMIGKDFPAKQGNQILDPPLSLVNPTETSGSRRLWIQLTEQERQVYLWHWESMFNTEGGGRVEREKGWNYHLHLQLLFPFHEKSLPFDSSCTSLVGILLQFPTLQPASEVPRDQACPQTAHISNDSSFSHF